MEAGNHNTFCEFLAGLEEHCLLIARHGETDWNAMGLMQGQQDRPLNPKGYQQRLNLFFQLQQVEIARIYTSSLQRSIQTALPLSEEKGIEIIKLKALNEVKLGVFEGTAKTGIDNEILSKMYHAFLKDEIHISLPGGGENLKVAYDRIRAPMLTILNSVQRHGHTLVVSHRNINKLIIKHVLNLSFETAFCVEHLNNWIYVYAPEKDKLYLGVIRDSHGSIHFKNGPAWVKDNP